MKFISTRKLLLNIMIYVVWLGAAIHLGFNVDSTMVLLLNTMLFVENIEVKSKI